MPEQPVDGPVQGVEASARRVVLAGTGAAVTAFVGSLCCIGPVVFVTLGVGAGLASTFEPLRPVFVGLTVGLLGVGFYAVYGRRSAPQGAEVACAADSACRAPGGRRRDEVVLWVATVIALVLLSFPAWSRLLV